MDRARKILIVDHDQQTRITLFEALSRKGYEVAVAEDGQMAYDMARRHLPDVLISEIKLPKIDGLALLHKLRKISSDLPVILITATPSIDTAVEAMKCSVFDYLIKPFPVDLVEASVERVVESLSDHDIFDEGTRPRKSDSADKPIIGCDGKLQMLIERAKSVASSKATVLLMGESGTGKEVFARLIHRASDRADGPFVALNCAALPETLLESELFGHEKGAFTGAVTTKKGKFELAHKGTLLLDEIGEVPIHLQSKLLRVLQEEEVDRLGGRAPVKLDVHVVATTNRSLESAVQEGTFRQDLYYRLNVIPLRLPPLRERPGDLISLADHFIEKYSIQYSKDIKQLSDASRMRFKEYEWPGNVREMENLMERAVLLAKGPCLEPWDFWDNEELPDEFQESGSHEDYLIDQPMGGPPGEILTLKEVERQMIMQALMKTDNNRTHAARLLGVSVRTLRNKLHEYRTLGSID
ncbi:MAG: sigma-54 dependent transcriptional regulator [Proteobacteria bacterium]|nr:sigma-54 dependent transcriptional regulator [Pseudomonadota bacterium]MBU1686816.1 sigma-54 dependent transcriptional regulator [Pseudomonadota bacterium]